MKAIVSKIISGGQTGADRAALDAAKLLKITTYGYCPKGYKTETGYDKSLKQFGLKQTLNKDSAARTALNIKHSDGTVIFGKIFCGKRIISPGTLLTLNRIKEYHKPYLINPTKRQFVNWVKKYNIKVLNVAGNRQSENPFIYKTVYDFLLYSFEDDALNKFRNTLSKIRTDSTSGSKALLNELINAVIKYLKNSEDNRISTISNILKETAPFTVGKISEMIVLYKFIEDFKRIIKSNPTTDALKYCLDKKSNYTVLSKKLNLAAINSINFKNKTVLLISNSSSITSLFKELSKRRISLNVIQCKSYPSEEGLFQSAVLKSYGYKVKLINDNDMKDYLLKTDFVLFGCDAYNKKYFSNKTGSFIITKTFYSANKPVYVLADKEKFSINFHKKQNTSGMFDIVPLSYVTKIIISE